MDSCPEGRHGVTDLLQASCGVCMLGFERPAQHGMALVRCVRFSKMQAAADCCRFFMAPSGGYAYPEGSPRDQAKALHVESVALVFDPRRGLQRIGL